MNNNNATEMENGTNNNNNSNNNNNNDDDSDANTNYGGDDEIQQTATEAHTGQDLLNPGKEWNPIVVIKVVICIGFAILYVYII